MNILNQDTILFWALNSLRGSTNRRLKNQIKYSKFPSPKTWVTHLFKIRKGTSKTLCPSSRYKVQLYVLGGFQDIGGKK